MGVYATAIFDIRNIGKVSHGDKGRIGAAAAQTTNLVNAASKSSIEPLQKGATTILNYKCCIKSRKPAFMCCIRHEGFK